MNIGTMYIDFKSLKEDFNMPKDALFKRFKVDNANESIEIEFYTEENRRNFNSVRRTKLEHKSTCVVNEKNIGKAEETSYYDQIVSNLKLEAKYLNERLEHFREFGDMNNYIATLKSLRETLNLIKQYDWQLMYSEYGVVDKEDKNSMITSMTNFVTEIAVWEQNHEGQIRNHKVFRTNIPYNKNTEGRPIK